MVGWGASQLLGMHLTGKNRRDRWDGAVAKRVRDAFTTLLDGRENYFSRSAKSVAYPG